MTKAVKEAADRLDVNPKVDEFEAFLKKYSAVLHQNHVILIDKKYTLAKMYGRMEGKLEHFIYFFERIPIYIFFKLPSPTTVSKKQKIKSILCLIIQIDTVKSRAVARLG